MPLDLPAPSTERLRRSPLGRVICQVRHEREMSTTDPKRALAVHEKLRDAYPRLDEINSQEIALSANAQGVQSIQQSETRGGWKFSSVHDDWTVTIAPDFFALDTTNYLDWEDFVERLRNLVSVVDEVFDLTVEKRLGLRYVDNISMPAVKKPADWSHWIDTSLLGPIVHPAIGDGVTSTQNAFVVHAGDGQDAVVRHGCIQDASGELAYVLDTDCFRAKGMPLEPNRLMAGAEELHTLALQLFQASITDELRSYFLGGDDD